VEVQVKVVELPTVIVAGLACSETVGTGGGAGGAAPPPPQAIAPTTRDARKRTNPPAEADSVAVERMLRCIWSKNKKVRKTMPSCARRRMVLGGGTAFDERP